MKELKYLNICYDLKENNEKVYDFLYSYTKNIFKYDNQDELINLINTKDIDLIITKYNFELLKEIRFMNKQIQIFVFINELNHTHLLESLEIKYIKFIQKLNCINKLIYLLKDCVKNIDSKESNIIKLKNDFIYDTYNQTLFKKNNIISLTNKESLFLNFLFKNYNIAVKYNDINKEIWNNNMKQDTLRSLIKILRKKTYKELIKNVSGIGYRIDI